MSKIIWSAGISLLVLLGSSFLADHNNRFFADPNASGRAEILFLGNTAKLHDSGKFAPSLAIDLFARGINITYTTDTADLNPKWGRTVPYGLQIGTIILFSITQPRDLMLAGVSNSPKGKAMLM